MDGLGECRVRVDRTLQIFGTGFELHGDNGLADQLASHRPDDMHAQQPVGGGISQHLDEPGRLLHGPGPAAG